MTKILVYLCFFCKIGNWIKDVWNKIVDLLKDVADFFTDLAEKVLNFIVDKVLGPIIEAVIDPIMKAVMTQLSEIVKKLVSEMAPLVEQFLLDIAQPIFELIISVLEVVWTPMCFTLFAGMLKIMDLFENIFDIFSGIADIEYNGNKDFLLNVFFKNNLINQVFWGITLLAIAILIIFTVIAIIKNMSNLDSTQTNGQILGMSIKAMAILFILPFVSLVLVNLSSVVLRKTSEIVTLSQNGEHTASIGTLTFLTFTMNVARDDNYRVNPSFTDELRTQYMSGKRDYAINGMGDFAVEEINYLLAFVVSAVMLFIIILCAIVFVVKIFEVVILYVTSPFFVATIVLDEGVKFKEWCKMFVAKMLGGFGMVIVMKLFFIVSPIVMSNDVVFSNNSLANLLIKALFMIGGLWAAYKSGNLIMQIVNINAAYQEAGLSSEIATRAVRAGIKYGTMAVKAVATGGATLAMDAKNIALDAGKSMGETILKAEDNAANSERQKQDDNAFRGGNSIADSLRRNDSGSSGMSDKGGFGSNSFKESNFLKK